MSNVVTRANAALDDDKSKSEQKDAKKKDEREKSGTPKESVSGTPAKPAAAGAAAKVAANGSSAPRQESPARVKPTTSQDKKDDKKEKKDDKKEKKDDKKEKKDDKKEKKDEKKEEKKNEKDKEIAKSKSEKVQNGDSGVRNGVADVALNRNGVGVESNGLNGHSMGPGSEDIEEECSGAGGEHNDDELFPELNYDEDDGDLGEGEGEVEEREDLARVDRSATRRSQVKQTRTPETPQPATKQTEKELANGDEKKQDGNTEGGKVLKLKEDMTSRKLRSAGGAAELSETADSSCLVLDDDDEAEDGRGAAGAERTKTDTNYSRCRAKVSPYRRSARLHASNMADYTGNNSTMEMDFTASFEGGAGEGSGAGAAAEWGVASLRSVRARRSYKLLPDLDVSKLESTKLRNASATSESTSRPTVHVVGRKRKTEIGDDVTNEKCRGDVSGAGAGEEGGAGVKRMRLLERVVSPWWRRRSLVPASTPLPLRRHHAIVGVNSDLPLHGSLSVEPPVVADTAPESLKRAALPAGAPLPAAAAGAAHAPVELAVEADEARNRCSIQ